jgi:aarF domain-containing kinase
MFARQIFHTGFVHADPHPGNIFIRPLPRGQDAQVVLLDHGLYMNVEERWVWLLALCTGAMHAAHIM